MNILKFTNFAICKDRRTALVLREDSTKRKEQPLMHGKLGWSRLVGVIAIASAVFCGPDRSVRADLFVSDLGNLEVRKFTDAGTPIPPIPFIGSGGGGEGYACVMLGSQGKIFLANNGSTIKIYDPANGAFLGTFASGNSGLVSVAALSLSPDGTLLYAADYGGNKIVAFRTLDPDPMKLPIYSVSTQASHDVRVDVRVGSDGSVYATDFQHNTGVLKFTSTLSASVPFVSPCSPCDHGLDSPAGMTFDRIGNLWVSNFHNNSSTSQVNEYDASGTWIQTVNNSTPGTQDLNGPFGLDVGPDPDRNIYVTSFFTDNVEKIDVNTGGQVTMMSDFLAPNDAGHEPKYLGFTRNCVPIHEVFPAEQCCGEKPHFNDPDYASVFTGQVAVGTDFGAFSDDFVLNVVDLKNQASAPLNTNYAPPFYHGPAASLWTKGNLGNIFGVTLDESGNIYVTATTAYNVDFFPAGATGGEIYKIDGATGAITTFKTLPQHVPPPGAGLGNIAYDCTHRNFYVSNTDNGLIYRLDLNGNILSTWDHGLNLPTANPPSAAIPDDPTMVFTALGRRVWGLQAHGGRLYYGVWWEDSGRPDPVHANQVWSIALSSGGNFVPGTDQLEITMPVDVLIDSTVTNYSNPVSGISFGPTGTMLLAERTMLSDTTPNAHQSRALEYMLSGTSWIPTTHVFAIGDPTVSSTAGPPLIVAASCAGGVDYDFGAGGRVWVTGDALHFHPNDFIYGLQGLPASGGSILNSILIDLNGDVSTGNKTEIGTVKIPCPDCEINGTVVTPSTVDGPYTYQFTVTNHTNQAVSNIVILPVSGVTFITPQTFHLSPPLQPGQTSQLFTITLGGVQPGVQACFNIALVATDGSTCCSRQLCVPIPSCYEVLEQRVECLPNNMARLTVTIKNLETYTLYYAAVLPSDPSKTATPDFFTLNPTVPPLGITTISTVISPVAPDETVLYTLTIHSSDLAICCSRDLSFTANCPAMPVLQTAVSRMTHGSAGDFDIPLPLSGTPGIEDRSSEPGVLNLIFTFDHNILVSNVTITAGTGVVSGFTTDGPQLTVQLTDVADAQTLTLNLDVTDTSGLMHSQVSVSLGVLVGDVNGNAVVNASDVSLTKSQVGQPVSTSNFREDVNANGLINSVDVTQVKANVGTALPP